MSSELTLIDIISNYTVLYCRSVCVCVHTCEKLMFKLYSHLESKETLVLLMSMVPESTSFLANKEMNKI